MWLWHKQFDHTMLLDDKLQHARHLIRTSHADATHDGIAQLLLPENVDALRILVEYPFTNWAEGDWVAHKQETPAAYSKEARRGPEPNRDEDHISDSFSRLVELFGTE